MKGKVIINNQEIEIEINEEQLEQLKIKKKTGYERVADGQSYYYDDGTAEGDDYHESHDGTDNKYYEFANYYTDKQLMLNNARADRLMRQLRRFAVENRKTELDWKNGDQSKWEIYIDYRFNKLTVSTAHVCRYPGNTVFDSKETAEAAIEKFKDELIWYFTEYKDSL